MSKRKQIIASYALIIMVTVLLASCGSSATPEPTIDVNLIATNAVHTIEARASETAAAQPTATLQPTYTPVSYTPTPAAGSVALPTAGSGGTVPTTGAAAPTAGLPVAAPTATLGSVGDKGVWASQTIADGTHYKAGETDDLTWYITNIGTTTWTTSYSIRFFTGTNFAKAGNTRYALPGTTAPQETGAATIDIVAPSTAGSYTMSWVLSNENDENFYIVDINIIVD